MSNDNHLSDLDEQDGVQVNEDGSITLAQSGITAKGPAPLQWVGGELKPDVRFGSLVISKFINCLMYDGKKSTAEEIFYTAMENIADKLKSDPLSVFDHAPLEPGGHLSAPAWLQPSLQPIRLELQILDLHAEHDDGPAPAVVAGIGKLEAVAAPQPQPALVVARQR